MTPRNARGGGTTGTSSRRRPSGAGGAARGGGARGGAAGGGAVGGGAAGARGRPSVARVLDATERLRTARAALPVPPPPDRGRLVYDAEIPDRYLGGLPGIARKVRWVRAHLPRDTRVRIGRRSAWYEADVAAYVASLRGELREPGRGDGRAPADAGRHPAGEAGAR